MTTSEKFTTVHAIAFTGETAREHDVLIGEDGTVKVWDQVADAYTSVHVLSGADQQRARLA